MEDPPRVHSDPRALGRLEVMLREEPGGDARANADMAEALAGLLAELGAGELDSVREALAGEAWREGLEPDAVDEERLAFTRGLCRDAAAALERDEPLVMAAGIALRRAMGLWLEGGDPTAKRARKG